MDDLEWIREGLKRPGKSQAGLARALRLHPAAIHRLLKGERELKAREVERIRSYLDSPEPESGRPARPASVPLESLPPNVAAGPDGRPLSWADMPRDIPVEGVAVGGADGDFSFNGGTGDYARRPPGIAQRKGVFAIYCQGESMIPWRRPRQLVYVDGADLIAPQIGDHVIVECMGQDGEPGPAYLKLLKAADSRRVVLAQYNPPIDNIEVARVRIRRIFRVIDWPELLGV